MDVTSAILYAILFIALYFEVVLLITFLEARFERAEQRVPKKSMSLPTVAVIVPCYNEEGTVADTLYSLLALNYPKEKLEIIAVNDGSTDTTGALLDSFASEVISVIHKENGGKHSAMNAALAQTQAEIIGCLDADSFVDSDALMHIIRKFDDTTIDAVTPGIVVHSPNSVLQLVQRAEYGLSIFVRKTFALLDAIFITPGPFSFFRRSALEEIGPWKHAHSTEDFEMGIRLQRHGKRIANEPEARVHTVAPATLRELFKQRIRWTYGFIKNSYDYSFMFFNPKYGTLGLLVLPMSAFSLLSAMYLFFAIVWNAGVFVVEEFIRFQTIGVSVPVSELDIFYVSTAPVVGITFTLLFLTVVLMIIGKRLSRDSGTILDIPLYILLYSFLAPVWLTLAVYKSIAGSNVRWR